MSENSTSPEQRKDPEPHLQLRPGMLIADFGSANVTPAPIDTFALMRPATGFTDEALGVEANEHNSIEVMRGLRLESCLRKAVIFEATLTLLPFEVEGKIAGIFSIPGDPDIHPRDVERKYSELPRTTALLASTPVEGELLVKDLAGEDEPFYLARRQVATSANPDFERQPRFGDKPESSSALEIICILPNDDSRIEVLPENAVEQAAEPF